MSGPTEIAWAAGFFDGEGSLFVNHHHQRHANRRGKPRYPCITPVASISHVRLEPLRRFAAVVGGRRPTGPYKPRAANGKPYFRWDACGRPSVHRIVCLLWPFLSQPKREQAERVWAELEQLKRVKSPTLPELPTQKGEGDDEQQC